MSIATPRQLLARIRRLRSQQPQTAKYSDRLKALLIWSDEGVWYRSQKEHWEGWLMQYRGPGAYDRKVTTGRSAAFVYNHIVCPPMLLWIAEASGVANSRITWARRAALASERRLQSHCSAIRRVIPWDTVEAELLTGNANRSQRRPAG